MFIFGITLLGINKFPIWIRLIVLVLSTVGVTFLVRNFPPRASNLFPILPLLLYRVFYRLVQFITTWLLVPPDWCIWIEAILLIAMLLKCFREYGFLGFMQFIVNVLITLYLYFVIDMIYFCFVPVLILYLILKYVLKVLG